MTAEFETLLDQYSAWLRSKITARDVGGAVEITTPFLDRHNDHLQIYAVPDGDNYLLTDDGYTITDLEMSGFSFTPRREEPLRQILNGFGVHRNGDALEVRVSPETFARKKHNLVQAILAVNDLFCLASPMVQRVFSEDVAMWLDSVEVRYIPHVRFTGQSGFDHSFDFVIPKSRNAPERMIRAMNRPDRNAAQSMVFAWTDTREVRDGNAVAYAILNDNDQRVSGQVVEALGSYGVKGLLWSRRDEFRELMRA